MAVQGPGMHEGNVERKVVLVAEWESIRLCLFVASSEFRGLDDEAISEFSCDLHFSDVGLWIIPSNFSLKKLKANPTNTEGMFES